MTGDDAVSVLRRWRHHGADYQVLHLSDDLAVVELCTCFGEPVDRLESGDPRLVHYLRNTVAGGESEAGE